MVVPPTAGAFGMQYAAQPTPQWGPYLDCCIHFILSIAKCCHHFTSLGRREVALLGEHLKASTIADLMARAHEMQRLHVLEYCLDLSLKPQTPIS